MRYYSIQNFLYMMFIKVHSFKDFALPFIWKAGKLLVHNIAAKYFQTRLQRSGSAYIQP